MILRVAVALFSCLLILASVASLIRWEDWWIRVFDFPRLQITISIVLSLILSGLCYNFRKWWHFTLVTLLLASLVFQLVKIYPYTILAPFEVLNVKKEDPTNNISILVFNVLQTNRESDRLMELVDELQPQLLLTLESDKHWEKELDKLEKEYPFSVKIPLDNLYGMHLYSKLELQDVQKHYLVQEDIPSIEALVKLKSGKKVKIFCLHPRPPAPNENTNTLSRDAELLIVGKKVGKQTGPALVFGDFNDVAWSATTTMFQKTSGLLDPRKGRGFFNTFSAHYPLLRWPLDHVFHTNDFKLNNIQRLPDIGSDHFPIYISLQYQHAAKAHQEEPTSDPETEERINEKIDEADSLNNETSQ